MWAALGSCGPKRTHYTTCSLTSVEPWRDQCVEGSFIWMIQLCPFHWPAPPFPSSSTDWCYILSNTNMPQKIKSYVDVVGIVYPLLFYSLYMILNLKHLRGNSCNSLQEPRSIHSFPPPNPHPASTRDCPLEESAPGTAGFEDSFVCLRFSENITGVEKRGEEGGAAFKDCVLKKI